MPKYIQNIIVLCGMLVIVLIVGASVYLLSTPEHSSLFPLPGDDRNKFADVVLRFSSDDEFVEYMREASELTYDSGVFLNSRAEIGMPMARMGFEAGEANAKVERYLSTNLQVAGIDEPDIVKTNGEELFVASPYYGPILYEGGMPRMMPSVIIDPVSPGELETYPSPYQRGGVKSITVYPPADLANNSTIDGDGELFLVDDTLVVISTRQIRGYDVSRPEKPDEQWSIELEQDHGIITSRVYDGTLYIVSAHGVNFGSPCPIPLYTTNDAHITIPCHDIYHPVSNIPVDVTYSVAAINIENGEMKDSVTFVGSRNNTTVYLSTEALYVSYQMPLELIAFFSDFFSENSDVVSPALAKRVKQLSAYDIGYNAKMTELQESWMSFINSLGQDERLRIENELQNRVGEFFDEHKRTLTQSGLMKISREDLDIIATGTIPGRLLNQFSLDEYDGYLRVATTIDAQWAGLSGLGQFGKSVNDIHVLDGDLKIIGSIIDLGFDERIYSARFIEDRGYLVTYKQIDPFFVLDLSDPKNPEIAGELKIPGFSSYLHPIDRDTILGVGMDGSQVKTSLFDVSNPRNPREQDTYTLNEYWSDIQNTHHAFLQDAKHEVFFLPAGNGAYVFSYTGDALDLKKAVNIQGARRAIVINDYLYIVTNDRVIALNENDWERVNELKFN